MSTAPSNIPLNFYYPMLKYYTWRGGRRERREREGGRGEGRGRGKEERAWEECSPGGWFGCRHSAQPWPSCAPGKRSRPATPHRCR